MCAHINDYNCNLYIYLIVILCKNIMEKQKCNQIEVLFIHIYSEKEIGRIDIQ